LGRPETPADANVTNAKSANVCSGSYAWRSTVMLRSTKPGANRVRQFASLLGVFFTSIVFVALAAGRVENASRARASDVAEAEKFLSTLPPACSMSRAYAGVDRTVHVRIVCAGSGKAVDGSVSIRNGVVTDIK
jgi:hypothetical protein